MERLGGHLVLYLSEKKLNQTPVYQITIEMLLEFLEPYKTSGTNFNSRRRTLSANLIRMVKSGWIEKNPLTGLKKQKEYAHLYLPFKKEQLKQVLDRVSQEHPQLYLGCLLMYGCLLRPHQEIRLLKRGDFDETLSRISLKPSANVVLVPPRSSNQQLPENP
jgi:site-specific recombinase XerC